MIDHKSADIVALPWDLQQDTAVFRQCTKSTGGRAPTYGEAMKRCLEQALEASGGKIYGEDGAAVALGLKPTTLQSKMRKLGIGR